MAERTYEIWQTSNLDEDIDKTLIEEFKADTLDEAMPTALSIIRDDITSYSFVESSDKFAAEQTKASKNKAMKVHAYVLRDGKIVTNDDGSLAADIEYFVCESGGM